MAERGVAEAQFSLGLSHASGKGAALDYAQAEHWYLKAADQNHALAQFNLGIMYANGQGTPCDRAKYLSGFRKPPIWATPGRNTGLASVISATFGTAWLRTPPNPG